ncbi:MAG: low molecular weight protein-tyrosine-phosphatase [Weeksellaceae bacterium]|jgi:protein-tyrosine phosphatase|nr:low molecular weight phosphotyrosine protein phosphatase [Weeksellaceae bacterium]MDX9705088.1 low molecular weight protein-tyrosine-phosphatase [Weeksellaceae bacterium]
MKILMVCLGNICRSPMAEGILRSKLSDDFEVDSAGTGNWHAGEAPDFRAITVAKRKGVDISKLKARQFKISDFEKFDVIFAMDKSNYSNIIALAKNQEQKNKVKMLLDKDMEVPDPYYGNEKEFEDVFQLLDASLSKWADKLKYNES